MTRACAVIVAAGSGLRMDSPQKKQFMKICGRPVVAWTVEAFECCAEIGEIILVIAADDIGACERDVLRDYSFLKVKKLTAGGKSRQDSVANGIAAASAEYDFIVVHDGVRPLIEPSIIGESVKAAAQYGAACVAVPITDTIKLSDKPVSAGDGICGFIDSTIDRNYLWAAQTPQCFKRDVIRRALCEADKRGYDDATDEASLIEMIGDKVAIVMGSYENIKITTPIDLKMAEYILQKRKNDITSK